MDTTQLRAISYGRVSTGKQAESGLSLDAQERKTAHSIELKEWDHVAHLTDEGRSGRKASNRAGLQKALNMLEAGEADVLVVAKLDRLARSVIDFARIMQTADKQGWDLVLLDLDADTTTPAGRLMVRIFAACAEFESDRISERVTETHVERKLRGGRHGKPELDEATRQRIGAERAEGKSLRAIAEGLTADGIKTARGGKWHASTVKHVLNSLDVDAAALAA